MATFKKYDIEDTQSIEINLTQRIGPTHLSRQLEQIVSQLDTSGIEAQYSSRGQNALHPKLMLSIIFYGYAIGIRSGRKLAAACEENLAFIYLSKGYFPKKSAINDFRKANYAFFTDLFNQLIDQCVAAKVLDPTVTIVDGSKLLSNSAKRRTKTKDQFVQWRSCLVQDIAALSTTDPDSKKNNRQKQIW